MAQKTTKPKKAVKKEVNVKDFDQLTEEEQDALLDKMIDGIDEDAGTTTPEDDNPDEDQK